MDTKQEEDKKVSNWIAETREVAYDAEDAIENYNLRDDAAKSCLKSSNMFLDIKPNFAVQTYPNYILN